MRRGDGDTARAAGFGARLATALAPCRCLAGAAPEEFLLVTDTVDPRWPAGAVFFPGDGQVFGAPQVLADAEALRELAGRLSHERPTELVSGALAGVDVLKLSQAPPARILVLGAGPDAQPVVTLAAQLGWSATVIDHRSHYARTENFPDADAILDGGSTAAEAVLRDEPRFSAAVVMSHHLNSDLAYLRALARSDVPYVGLLGPAIRREKLLSEMGEDAHRLAGRLRSPVGLDLGADTPEAIALAIVAEIHAVLAGRTTAGPMSVRAS